MPPLLRNPLQTRGDSGFGAVVSSVAPTEVPPGVPALAAETQVVCSFYERVPSIVTISRVERRCLGQCQSAPAKIHSRRVVR